MIALRVVNPVAKVRHFAVAYNSFFSWVSSRSNRMIFFLLFFLFSYLFYYLLYFYVLVVSIYISCESNRQNESHDDPMNERFLVINNNNNNSNSNHSNSDHSNNH